MSAGVRILYAGPHDVLSMDVLARVAEKHARRDIVLSYDPPPIPFRGADWTCTDWQTYDGADDSGNRHQVGRGRTAEAALRDLLDILEHDDEERGVRAAINDSRGLTALATDYERRMLLASQGFLP